MRPGTLHFVLGPEPTIVYGRHFYCASTMALTCASTVHTFVLNPVITNQEHRSTRTYLGRMMAIWMEHYAGSASKYGISYPIVECHV